MKEVGIIGAGPSGIVAAKIAHESGFKPTVFESSSDIGGLWKPKDGFIWNDMRTNLSKWTCVFSDYPWENAAAEFPAGRDVHGYLRSYARHFGVDACVELHSPVTSVEPARGKWAVRVGHSRTRTFDSVIVATGVFSRPHIPMIANLDKFGAKCIHSAQYRSADQFKGRRVAVVGSSFSAIEIAANLADHGVETVLVFQRPAWILPRYARRFDKNGTAPIDLVLSYREEEGVPRAAGSASPQEAWKAAARFFEERFGNPGTVHEALRPLDAAPAYAVVSDSFLDRVRDGGILPVKEAIASVYDGALLTTSGKHKIDSIILCTGYQANLDFLGNDVKRTIEYLSTDMLMPFVADKSVMHPSATGLFFVGLYRGPYFGVMELQARWAAMALGGDGAMAASMEGVERERAIRRENPRPQFPHEYVTFSDETATRIGVMPDEGEFPALARVLKYGPVVPAQYRLRGSGAKQALAMDVINDVCDRSGFK